MTRSNSIPLNYDCSISLIIIIIINHEVVDRDWTRPGFDSQQLSTILNLDPLTLLILIVRHQWDLLHMHLKNDDLLWKIKSFPGGKI
ncbi:hypothetical protein LOK49_LG09G01230 [Camellia lanceoleosa]|uniref:Uncharacterized protein n=1 Tax=Camellia lanceoleosa TaxID=1840588 RepID=A0ACC0GH15_9ERIC|nr:hypothetical protein LOK49_LG09G01230 [Camellia lanceoleosa]